MSDPAPLPRLGEVFFDVRGNSRSMRLSWYADTGVAVFSIWQAGMCTGTFRLPMADLSRMIGILERGPSPQGRGRPPVSASRHEEDRRPDAGDSDWYYGPGGDEPGGAAAAGNPGGYGPERPAEHGRSGRGSDYGRGDRGPADHGAGGYGEAGRGGAADLHDADYEAGGGYAQPGYGGPDRTEDTRYYGGDYGPPGQPGGDYPAQGYPAGYGRDQFADDGGHDRRGYDQGGYDQGGYDQGGYEQGGYEQPGYDQGGYEQPGYEQPGYAGTEGDYGTGEYSGHPAEDRGRPDRGYPGTEGSGYHDERFTAPYVADGGQTYPNENQDPRGGYPDDIRDAAYPADRRRDSRSERYPEPSAAEEAYSYGADYRHR